MRSVFYSWVESTGISVVLAIYAVAQSIEALRQKQKVAGSIPDGVNNFFYIILPAALWLSF